MLPSRGVGRAVSIKGWASCLRRIANSTCKLYYSVKALQAPADQALPRQLLPALLLLLLWWWHRVVAVWWWPHPGWRGPWGHGPWWGGTIGGWHRGREALGRVRTCVKGGENVHVLLRRVCVGMNMCMGCWGKTFQGSCVFDMTLMDGCTPGILGWRPRSVACTEKSNMPLQLLAVRHYATNCNSA